MSTGSRDALPLRRLLSSLARLARASSGATAAAFLADRGDGWEIVAASGEEADGNGFAPPAPGTAAGDDGHAATSFLPLRWPQGVEGALVLTGAAGRAADDALRPLVAEAERLAAEAAEQGDGTAWRELLATLGHELRNALNSLRAALGVLEQRPDDAEIRSRTLLTLQRQVMHLARLGDDLAEAAEVDGGRLSIRLERTDLVQVVREALEVHGPLLAGAGLHLRFELPPGPLWVDGDALRLSQAIANLLHNATKFTDRDDWVEVTLASAGDEAELRVRDSGQGVEAGRLPEIFEPFRRGDGPRERSAGGLGLGLAVVRHLIEAHGGRVRAESDGPDTGTVFVVHLPRRDGGDSARGAAARRPPARSRGPRGTGPRRQRPRSAGPAGS